ncbi:MAG: hypothetical protein WAU61_13060 [Smithella sp.]
MHWRASDCTAAVTDDASLGRVGRLCFYRDGVGSSGGQRRDKGKSAIGSDGPVISSIVL